MFYSLGLATTEWKKKIVDGIATGSLANGIAKVEAFATKFWTLSPGEAKWRICLLCQVVVDMICFPNGYATKDLDACEKRFYRLKKEYQDYFLPFMLYRMWLAGGNVERLLHQYMLALEGKRLPEKFMDSVLFVGMVATFRGDEALLGRVQRIVAAHYGDLTETPHTGRRVQEWSRYFEACERMLKHRFDKKLCQTFASVAKETLIFDTYTHSDVSEEESGTLPSFFIMAIYVLCVVAYYGSEVTPPATTRTTFAKWASVLSEVVRVSDCPTIWKNDLEFANWLDVAISSGMYTWPSQRDPVADNRPLMRFLQSVVYRGMDKRRQVFLPQLERKEKYEREFAQLKASHKALYEVADAAIARGDRVLGATMRACLNYWGTPTATLDEATKKAALFGTEPTEERWKMALEGLQKVAEKAAAKRTKQEPFYWALKMSPVAGEEGFFTVTELGVYRKGTRRFSTLRSFLTGRRNYIFGFGDEALADYIKEWGYNGYWEDFIPMSVLQRMVGHPRLVAIVEDELFGIELGEEPLRLRATKHASGALELSAPEKFDLIRQKQSNAAEPVFLKRTSFRRFDLMSLPNEVEAAVELLTSYGEGGSLMIPAQSLEQVMPQLVKIAKQIPSTGSLRVEEVDETLPQVAVSPTPHLRIASGEGETFWVELRVMAAEEAFVPGEAPERLVRKQEGQSVLLVRNLKQEQEAATTVYTSLQAFSGIQQVAQADFKVDGLAAMLDLLSAAQNLHEHVVVEWLEPDKALRVNMVSTIRSSAKSKGVDHWFSLQGNFTLDDDRVLSLQEVLRALPNRVGEYIRLEDGDYLRLSKRLQAKLDVLNAASTVRKNHLELPMAALPAIDAVFTESQEEKTFSLPKVLKDGCKQVRDELAREVTLPEGLTAELRPYQKDGFTWLSHLAALGIGSCLADDMGLGKTLELIALLVERRASGPSLVVVPSSLGFNWVQEISRFAPVLTPKFLHGITATEEAVQDLRPGDVVVTSYGMLVSRGERFAEQTWNILILDEAQAIKNANTQRFKAVKTLKATTRIVATGTPVENSLEDFWSLFDFLNPGMLLSREAFLKCYTNDGMATDSLKALVTPLVLRRLKKDVLKDLPPKTEINLDITLTDDERNAYEACRRNALENIKALEDGAKGMAVLRELTRLRRFCCHPSLVYPEMQHSTKLDTLVHLLAELKAGGHRALIFSQYVDVLTIVQASIKEKGWSYEYLDGSTSPEHRRQAVKAFQSNQSDFFLISLKAGGFGLTLTAADYVILLDPWWNPAVENQAADRVHRIGQTQPVTIYRLVTKDTIEERVIALHNEKRTIAENLLEGAGSSSLSTAEMLALITNI